MRLLSTLKPTQNQLTVLAKIVANKDHPAKAASEISGSENLVSARNMLMKLNVITYSDTSAALTEKGEQLAKEQNIIDDSGNLTDEGQKLVSGDQPQQGQPPMDDMGMGMDAGMPGGDMGGMPEPPMGGGGMGGMPGMESFSPLFKNLLRG